MRRYFFQIDSERGTQEDPGGIALSDHSAAMLHAVTMCAEIGCSGGFLIGFAVSVLRRHPSRLEAEYDGVAKVAVHISAPRPPDLFPHDDSVVFEELGGAFTWKLRGIFRRRLMRPSSHRDSQEYERHEHSDDPGWHDDSPVGFHHSPPREC